MILDDIYRYLETKHPEEGCGLVFEEADGARTFTPMPNLYDKYHSVDPVTFPRTNRTAYFMNPRELQRLQEAADQRKARLGWIVHSHCDVGSYFSAEDVAMAAPDGVQLYPGTHYLVVAVDLGRVTNAKLFAWTDGKFLEVPLPQN